MVPPGVHAAKPQSYIQQGFSQPAQPIAPHQRQSTVPNTNSYLELGKLGAVVGLCGAGAANLRRLQADQVSRGEALFDTLRTGVAAGLATATAGLVANQFRAPSLSLLATLATGTAMMYVLNTERIEKPMSGAQAGDRA
jgi:hypothetical protein